MDNVERLRKRLLALVPVVGGEVLPAVREALEGELLRDPVLIVQALPELRKLGAAARGPTDVERMAWSASIIERVLAGFGPVARQQFPTTELFARGLLELMDRALDPG